VYNIDLSTDTGTWSIRIRIIRTVIYKTLASLYYSYHLWYASYLFFHFSRRSYAMRYCNIRVHVQNNNILHKLMRCTRSRLEYVKIVVSHTVYVHIMLSYISYQVCVAGSSDRLWFPANLRGGDAAGFGWFKLVGLCVAERERDDSIRDYSKRRKTSDKNQKKRTKQNDFIDSGCIKLYMYIGIMLYIEGLHKRWRLSRSNDDR